MSHINCRHLDNGLSNGEKILGSRVFTNFLFHWLNTTYPSGDDAVEVRHGDLLGTLHGGGNLLLMLLNINKSID